jgi:type II secretory pathway pseudopilin PulG
MKIRHSHRTRTQTGIYLIETLVAITIGAIIAFTLLQLLVESMRVATTNANRQAADLMAQTVLDSVKATSWYSQATSPPFTWPPPAPTPGGGLAFTPIPIGQYDLLPYSTTPGQLSSGHPLPVGLDLGDFVWASKVVSGHRFPGTVTLNVAAGPDGSSVISTAILNWSDSQNLGGKTVSTMTVSEQRGINYWPSP